MKIAIVGGGVFGTTIGWVLGKHGYKVDLFEKNRDLFMAASGINQYRIHKGYHYPRSTETILSCLQGQKQFVDVYKDSVLDKNNMNYYCVSKDDS